MRTLITTYLMLLLCGFTANAQSCSMGFAHRIKGCHSRNVAIAMAQYAEQYLYTTGSEGYDEDSCIEVLHAMIESPLLTDADKQRPTALLKSVMKNRPGQVAADISFITPNNKQHHLHECETPFTILLFNDPECEDCAEIKQQISSNSILQRLIDDKKLTVVGIYPYDDEAQWRATKYPDNMINGWDRDMTIEETESYVIPQIPTLYLRGEKQKVILKNTTLKEIISYFERQ